MFVALSSALVGALGIKATAALQAPAPVYFAFESFLGVRGALWATDLVWVFTPPLLLGISVGVLTVRRFLLPAVMLSGTVFTLTYLITIEIAAHQLLEASLLRVAPWWHSAPTVALGASILVAKVINRSCG